MQDFSSRPIIVLDGAGMAAWNKRTLRWESNENELPADPCAINYHSDRINAAIDPARVTWAQGYSDTDGAWDGTLVAGEDINGILRDFTNGQIPETTQLAQTQQALSGRGQPQRARAATFQSREGVPLDVLGGEDRL